tara:strand:+ start:7752 stop:7985 length:234 start_codon:yes stop_codon:yes gene_type:complete
MIIQTLTLYVHGFPSARTPILPNEYKCPFLALAERDPYVTKLYCDTFSEGRGCKYKPTCQEYNSLEFLNKQEEGEEL